VLLLSLLKYVTSLMLHFYRCLDRWQPLACIQSQILGTIALMEQSNPTNRAAKLRLVTLVVMPRHVNSCQCCVALLQILGTIALMEQSNPTNRPAKSRLVSGTWRLLWSQQAENASPLQKWGSSQSKNYQVGFGAS
jgi:hypothetical protein